MTTLKLPKDFFLAHSNSQTQEETMVDIVIDATAATGIVDATAVNARTTVVQTIGAAILEIITTGVVVTQTAGVLRVLQALLTVVHVIAQTIHVSEGAPSAILQITTMAQAAPAATTIPQTTM